MLKNAGLLESKGFAEGLLPKVNERLRFVGEPVLIKDVSLTSVLHQGTFLGVDDKYRVQLREDDGSVTVVSHGRMRQEP